MEQVIQKDWQGNEFRNGDILMLVKFIDLHGDYCWFTFFETEIFIEQNFLNVEVKIEEENKIIIFPLDFFLKQQKLFDFQTVCIKGVSDNEEAFFSKFLKPHLN